MVNDVKAAIKVNKRVDLCAMWISEPKYDQNQNRTPSLDTSVHVNVISVHCNTQCNSLMDTWPIWVWFLVVSCGNFDLIMLKKLMGFNHWGLWIFRTNVMENLASILDQSCGQLVHFDPNRHELSSPLGTISINTKCCKRFPTDPNVVIITSWEASFVFFYCV